MAQISVKHESETLAKTVTRFSARVREGIQWWAEHQAWPAIDEIRIDDRKR